MLAADRIACLAKVGNLVLLDAKAPVSFFAYPGKPSYLVPDACTVHTLSAPEQDSVASLDKLAAASSRRRETSAALARALRAKASK